MKLDDEEIARVCRLVDDVAGIQWDASKTYLIESRLPTLLTEFGCQTLSDLVNLVRQGTNQRVRTAFIDAVTTRETLFFRDQGPFEALKHKCLPEILDAKASTPYGKRLRIWSAACSSGQEPYSLGIVLHELLEDLKDWDIQILATDISPAALKSARTGIYSEFEMSRGVPQNLRDKYFTRVGDGWQVIDSVRSMVSFEHRNLLEPLANMGPFDVVFCRNVAIYFEADVRADLFERITGVMAPHGALFVGGSENLAALGEKWKPLYHCRGIFYLPNRKCVGPVASIDVVGPGKTALATASRAAMPPARHHPTAPGQPVPVARPVSQVNAGRAAPPVIGNRPAASSAGTASQRSASLTANSGAARPAKPTPPPPAATRPAAVTATRPVTPPPPATPTPSATRPASATTSRPAVATPAGSRPAATPSPTPKALAQTTRPVSATGTSGVTKTVGAASATTTARPTGTTRPAISAATTPSKPAVTSAKPLNGTVARPSTTTSTTRAAVKPAVTISGSSAVKPNSTTAKPATPPVKPVAGPVTASAGSKVAPPKHLTGRPVAPARK